jgi:uracil-DNA glycosylase
MATVNPAATALIKRAATTKDKWVRASLMTRARRLQLRSDIHGCEACPLRSISQVLKPIAFEGPSPALLTIIVNHPTAFDVAARNSKPTLYGPSTPPGKMLGRLLESIGMRRDDVFLMSATACPMRTPLGGDVTKKDTLAVAGRTKSDLDPTPCIERYAARALKLSGARVVLCLGEKALEVARHHKAFSPLASYAQPRDYTPTLQAGMTWVAGWSIEEAEGHGARTGDLYATFDRVGELVQADVHRFACETFPESTVVAATTYDQAVDEVFKLLAPAVKGLPPDRHRYRIMNLLGELADLVEKRNPGNARYAVRILEEFEAGKLLFPDIGHLAKGRE